MRLSETARGMDPRPPLVPMYEYLRLEEPVSKRLLYGLVLQFVAGKSLARLLAERRTAEQPLTPIEIRRLMVSVCTALEFAHGQTPPVLHRDVKAANVMVTPDRQALLMDFGIGRLLDDQQNRLTKTGTIAGTIAIMPPELLTSRVAVDERADVYMLGKLLLELLTFDLAGDAETRRDCPAAWVKLIDEATSQRSSNRPRTVRAFVERLTAQAERPQAPTPPPAPRPPVVVDPVPEVARPPRPERPRQPPAPRPSPAAEEAMSAKGKGLSCLVAGLLGVVVCAAGIAGALSLSGLGPLSPRGTPKAT
jgi:serine/threonine protein kinase